MAQTNFYGPADSNLYLARWHAQVKDQLPSIAVKPDTISGRRPVGVLLKQPDEVVEPLVVKI
jgi:hypothetical protein